MAVNKVVMNTGNGEQTLIDLTNDTVTSETLAEGYTAHAANGERVTGTMKTTTVLYTEQTLTEAQKAQARQNLGVGSVDEVAEEVLARLGTPVFGRVDADNNIILTGALVEGSYALKYENADGEVIDIGMLNMAEQLINYITTSINADGTQYLGTNGEKGYKVGCRLNSSGGESVEANLAVTGFIPVKANDVVYLKNTAILMGSNDHSYGRIAVYDENFAHIANGTSTNMANNLTKTYTTDASGYLNSVTLDNSVKNLSGAKYIRVSYHYLTQHGGTGNAGDAFISINKPID